MAPHDLPLDATGLSRDDRHHAQETLSDACPSPEELAMESEAGRLFGGVLSQAMQQLDPRERRIIQARLVNKPPKTLAEVGEDMSLSRERVRQLEVRAKLKLQQACRQAGLTR